MRPPHPSIRRVLSPALGTILLCEAILLSSVLSGCDTRVRDNPFDPLNPDTRGRPSLLTAVARDGYVDLNWSNGGMRHITSYTVYRGMQPDSLAPVIGFPAEYNRYRDVGLSNDSTYYFAIGFGFDGQAGLLTAAEPATPGPDVPWVLDAEMAPMARLGSDGRAVASRHGEGRELVDLSVEADRSLAWSLDPIEGVLIAYASNGNLGALYRNFVSPSRVSADLIDGGVWIISYNRGTLLRVDMYGRRTVMDDTLFKPLDVEASPFGGCWVSDEYGLIHRYSYMGERVTVEQVARPGELSAAPDRDAVWVANPVADQALKISPDSVLATVEDLDGPFGVAAAPDGGCWIADRERVLKVDRDGEVTLVVVGFTGAGAVDFNPRTGECWVADSLADKIVRIASDGTRIVTMTDVATPFDVAGDWGAQNRRPAAQFFPSTGGGGR